MNEHSRIVQTAADLEAPVTIGPDAYISPEYARAEGDRLWRDRGVGRGHRAGIEQNLAGNRVLVLDVRIGILAHDPLDAI